MTYKDIDMETKDEKEEARVFGGAELDEDEKSLLRRRPDFADEKIEVEFKMTAAKIRWHRMKNGYQEEEDEEDEMEKERQEQEEAELRSIYDNNKKVLYLGNRNHCNEEGSQGITNLNEKELRGLRKLNKRVNENEIVINISDKGKVFAVNTLESYQRQGEKHIEKDREIEWGKVEDIQKRMDSHSRALNNIFRMGAKHGDKNQRRIWEGYT